MMKLIDKCRLFGAFILFLVVPLRGQQHEPCPPDQVWGGSRCEWRDYCKDGQPRRDGHCPEDGRADGKETFEREEAPDNSSVGTPAKCPVGYILTDGHCTSREQPIICPDGKPSVNGKCPPAPRPCEHVTVFAHERDDGKASRHVLFVSGNLSNLFDRYLSDNSRANRKLDLEKLTVTFYDAAGRQQDLQERMSLGKYFNGKTIDRVWTQALKNKMAAPRAEPEIEARTLDADLVCGAGLR